MTPHPKTIDALRRHVGFMLHLDHGACWFADARFPAARL